MKAKTIAKKPFQKAIATGLLGSAIDESARWNLHPSSAIV
jgi:hypothetical protein